MEQEEQTELHRLREENERLTVRLRQRRAEDISQEAARAALHASEHRLRDTLESIDEGFVLIGRDWSVIDLNLRAVRMDGRPASRIVGRSVFELWPDTAATPLQAAMRRAMAERQPARLKHRFAAGGRERILALRIFPSAQGLSLFLRDATEQEAARQRLHTAEISARLAVEAGRLGTWSYDPRSGGLAWNEQHRALFGMQPGAPVDFAALMAGIHPGDRMRIDAAVRAAVRPGGSGELAEEYRSIDAATGAERWLAAIGHAQFEDGACVRFDGVVQDITQRRRAEAALAASEARFRAIAEALPGLVFVTDAAGLNTYTNPQFSEYTGVAASKLLGEGWIAIVHPDDRKRAAQAWAASVGSGAAYAAEQRFRGHDGAYRWFLCRGIPVRDAPEPGHAEGPISRWFGTCTDIQDIVEARQVTARDRDALERLVAERTGALRTTFARLREEEARMRALFRHSSDCLFLLRVEPGRGPVFLDVNPPAEAVLERSRAEAVGRTPQELLGEGPDAEHLALQVQAALRPGAGPHAYTARRRYGAKERLLEAVAVALDGPEGERLLLITARDVTEQRALEEALRQSQKMEAIGQLTGGLAHDFNNLLTGISGSLELMRSRAEAGRTAEIGRYAAAALESVQRAAALTSRLLAFGRRQTLDPRPADLNRLLHGMERLVRRTMGADVAAELALAPGLWPVQCDASQLETALLNLCLNARDAMPQGGTLRIATSNGGFSPGSDLPAARGGEDAVCITVTDTGRGMVPEVAARAFEPFFTTKPLGQGAGLGLSMLYGFARQSGGQVRLESEAGSGTTVRIELPRHLGELPAEAARDQPPPLPAGPDGRAILVVEDEELIRELAVQTLAEAGFRTLEAPDAAEAMRILQDGGRIDLLLTDVGLPGMNGRQLAEAAQARRPGLKVLFITGYAHHAAGADGLVGPGMALLPKPFALDALTSKVQAILSA